MKMTEKSFFFLSEVIAETFDEKRQIGASCVATRHVYMYICHAAMASCRVHKMCNLVECCGMALCRRRLKVKIGMEYKRNAEGGRQREKKTGVAIE